MSPMNNRLLIPRKTPGLLDLVPGAAAAYSLRSLSNSYAGPVVTVRRSNDNAEEDFTASEVADGTLAAFCGAGDGFVKQWWDQSGNEKHGSQTTAAYQPKIVSSGVVAFDEGKPALQFDGSDDRFSIPATSFAGYVFALARSTTSTYTFQALSSSLVITANASAPFVWCVRKTGDTTVTADTGIDCSVRALLSMQTIEDDVFIWVNGAIEAQDASTNPFPPTDTEMFARAGLGYFGGKVQEVIVYNADVSSQRELIEGNIAWSYSQ